MELERDKYEIEFTPLARAFATSRGGIENLEEQIRIELRELACEPLEIMFHSLLWCGVDFVMHPSKGKILVDTTTFEASEPLKDGPFKGMRVMLPRGDSEDR